MELADNLKTQTAYIHINGAINRTFLNRHPHELSPGQNLHKIPNIESWNADKISASYQTFPYTASFPTPMLFPEHTDNVLTNYINDPALQIVLEKEQWFKRKKKMKKIWKEDKALSKSGSIQSIADASCPRFLVDFAELLADDPDPNFQSTYNWYYTDGTLNVVDDNGAEILIHCSGFHDIYLHATPIKNIEGRYTINDTMRQRSIKLPNRKPIYQIISSQRNNYPLLVGIRQRNSFFLHNFKVDNIGNKIINFKEMSGHDTLTSAAFEDTCFSSICLADTNDNLDIYDLHTLNEVQNISLPKDESLVDKWSSIKYYDCYTLVNVNRKSIHTIDIRTDDNEISVYKPDLISDKCDEMSLFKFSKLQRNLLYVGTNHSLFSFDIRMLKDIQPLQRWTHGMKSTPHLIDSGIIDNNEIITLASPLVNEVRLVVNSHMKKLEDMFTETDEFVVHSYSLPWHPPCISDSILKSQIQGEGLKPNKYLKKRMNFCNSGMSLITNEESLHLFIQNSYGDVFQQEIRSMNKQFDNDDVAENLSNWIGNIDNGTFPLFATNIINMKPILSLLKEDSNDCEISKRKEMEKWCKPLSELSEYRDVLAADLLSAWDLADDKGDIPSQINKNSTTSEEKVSAWLQSAPVGENNVMNIFINEHVANTNPLNTPYNFMSQPTMASPIFEPIMMTSSQPITKPKKTVQKRRHFEGF